MPTTSPGAVIAEPSRTRAIPKSISLLCVCVGEKDVLGLDVAVHDAARVGVRRARAEVGRCVADVAVGELALALALGQRALLDQLADQVGALAVLAQLVEGHDAGMVEPRDGLRLAQDPLHGLALRARSP